MPETTKKNLIVITYPDGASVTLDAEKGEWTAYDYDGAAFIVHNGNALMGLYNARHVRSIEVKASAKEAATNG